MKVKSTAQLPMLPVVVLLLNWDSLFTEDRGVRTDLRDGEGAGRQKEEGSGHVGEQREHGRKWAGWRVMRDRASESQEGVLETAWGRQHLYRFLRHRETRQKH